MSITRRNYDYENQIDSKSYRSVYNNNLLLDHPIGARYEPGGNNKRPGIAQARTSEDIARWYDQKDLFIPIFYDATDISSAPESLKAVRNKIKPGSVLWFSREQPLSSEGNEGLLDSINHMGTIVSVNKDDDGNVTEWTMYHSYNETKNNDITTHWWNWPKNRQVWARSIHQVGSGTNG